MIHNVVKSIRYASYFTNTWCRNRRVNASRWKFNRYYYVMPALMFGMSNIFHSSSSFAFSSTIMSYQNSNTRKINNKKKFKINNNNMKGVFLGSGSAAMNEVEACKVITSLTGKPDKDCTVLYIGTATYDLPGPKHRQTIRFQEAGCNVIDLSIANDTLSLSEMKEKVNLADIIIVSGGNTLFAIDRWRTTGLDQCLYYALNRSSNNNNDDSGGNSVVFTGGSAGAICWFDSGHSDSMDPQTYKNAMLNTTTPNNNDNNTNTNTTVIDESSTEPINDDEIQSWEYIRIDGLGFLPGLCCPHHDRIQSNGKLRSNDFNEMLKRHKGERGICIDHWAGLIIDGNTFKTFAISGKDGSVTSNNEFCDDRSGTPGVWIKTVIEDDDDDDDDNNNNNNNNEPIIKTELVPSSGTLDQIFAPATFITKDPRVDICRAENPDDLA